VVGFKPAVNDVQIQSICQQEGAVVRERGRCIDYYVLGIPGNQSVEDAVQKFSSLPEVDFAEPNYRVYADWFPNDPLYWSDQWDLQRSNGLDMQLAWELTTGVSSVIVAVIDCGVAYENYPIPSNENGQVYSPDGQYHKAPDLADTRFVPGYDFVSNDSHPNDEEGHGTHVAGTIAQSTNNDTGAAGMAFNCTIMPVRVLNESGSGTETQVADGISYAWQNGARVLNLSLGAPWPESSHLEHEAIINATNAGAVVVAAAGNSYTDHLGYPAGFPECISVGAVDGNWQKTWYSNWGAGLDVVAPGGDLSTQNYWPITQNTFADFDSSPPHNVSQFDYVGLQGTSQATPHVSALVAMMMSRGINDPARIRNKLFSTAIDLGAPGWDTVYGYGLINPVAALGGVSEFYAGDDSSPAGQFYIDDTSGRFAVLCPVTLTPPFNITEASAMVFDQGVQQHFNMTINPQVGNFPDLSTNLAGPVTFTTAGDPTYFHWYIWDFPGVPRTNSNPFWVVFKFQDTTGPFVAGDTSGIKNRSAYYWASQGWTQATGNNWYLRAISLKDTLAQGIAEQSQRIVTGRPEIVSIAPEPARDHVRISYTLSRPGGVRLRILDVTGRVIRRLDVAASASGEHQVAWDGRDDHGRLLPAGVYYARLEIGAEASVGRVVLIP
jgi:serine protease